MSELELKNIDIYEYSDKFGFYYRSYNSSYNYQMQKWLREKHNINISIEVGEFEDDFDYFGVIRVLSKDCESKGYPRGVIRVPRIHIENSYEDCMLHCLKMALYILSNSKSNNTK